MSPNSESNVPRVKNSSPTKESKINISISNMSLAAELPARL